MKRLWRGLKTTAHELDNLPNGGEQRRIASIYKHYLKQPEKLSCIIHVKNGVALTQHGRELLERSKS